MQPKGQNQRQAKATLRGSGSSEVSTARAPRLKCQLTVVTGPVSPTQSLCLHSGKVSEKKRSKCDQTVFWLLLRQIAGLLKDNEKIHASPAAAPSDDDSEIKKIKKVKSQTLLCAFSRVVVLRNWPETLRNSRSRASYGAGSAGGSGRPLFRTISARRTQRAWGRGTRWCSACWTRRPSTSSSFTSLWTTFWDHSAWLPAPRSPQSPMTMSAAYSWTGLLA